MSHCDLCGTESDRLAVVDDLWGLGASAICEDADACGETWAPAFAAPEAGESHETDGPFGPSESLDETAVLAYGLTFDSLDAAPLRSPKTRRLRRA